MGAEYLPHKHFHSLYFITTSVRMKEINARKYTILDTFFSTNVDNISVCVLLALKKPIYLHAFPVFSQC